jgi:hypothetical protein
MNKYAILLILSISCASISAMHTISFFDHNASAGDPQLKQRVKSIWLGGCSGYASYLSGRMTYHCYQKSKVSNLAISQRRMRLTKGLGAISLTTAFLAGLNVRNFVTEKK